MCTTGEHNSFWRQIFPTGISKLCNLYWNSLSIGVIQLRLRVQATDLDWRYQTFYTAPCNGIVSHGAPIWVFGSLPTTHTETNAEKCTHDLYAHVCANLTHGAPFHVCLSSHSDRSRCRWHRYLTNHIFFWSRENPHTLNWSPCREENGFNSWMSSLNL